MANQTHYRIYNPMHSTKPRKKGTKKKARRMDTAWQADGRERKRANSLSPQQQSSKSILREILKDCFE